MCDAHNLSQIRNCRLSSQKDLHCLKSKVHCFWLQLRISYYVSLYFLECQIHSSMKLYTVWPHKLNFANKTCPEYDILYCIWWWGSSSKALRNVKLYALSPLLPGSLLPGVVVSVKVQSIGQIWKIFVLYRKTWNHTKGKEKSSLLLNRNTNLKSYYFIVLLLLLLLLNQKT